MQNNFLTPVYFYFAHTFPPEANQGQLYLQPVWESWRFSQFQQASIPKQKNERNVISPVATIKGQGEQLCKAEERQQPKEAQNQYERREERKRIKCRDMRCQEYIPYQSSKKSNKKAYQNAKRNIMPNIVHQIFCFIQKKKKSGILVQNYINAYEQDNNSNISVQRFYNYQKLIKQRTNHYINEKGIRELNNIQEPECSIYSMEEQQFYLKINRCLARYFLKKEIEPVILTSIRMKKQTRIWHLELKRRLMQDLINLMNDF